ncbi:MAG: DegT/DnrJ/EryC1/StrS aminotransferase family protein [Gammaproteobacteria bacterium]|nr:DegT/DnrJ/EryC1/StrS aminotransferase family protein [Gammaproteobacteria bacterium]
MGEGKFSVWPSFCEEECNAVARVLGSNEVNYWTGQEGRHFENEFAAYVGTKHAIAVANGTLALELALNALGLLAGDEVIVTPRTFIASVSSVVGVGGVPVFADVDANSGNITAETIGAVITSKTKAVICVHLAGMPCEMDSIIALAEEHDFLVIEDCAQAHGACYKGRPVGSIGHIAAWSFCQDKIMTTGGEGGMVTTNNHALWAKMWSYKDHGKSWEAVHEREHAPGFRWLHESFGSNWRLTEMQSAIGRIQLRKMPSWTAKRRKNAAMIDAELSQFDCVRNVDVPDHIDHACYKHYAYLRLDLLSPGWSRDRIVEEIADRGVPCFQGTCSEVYLEKAFDNTGWRPVKRLPIAKELGEASIMFLVHPTLTDENMEMTKSVINEVLGMASRRIVG